jgi:tetratricopeptide (TPR) repeat protein
MKKFLLAIALLASSSSLHAQEKGLPELVDTALKAMNAGDWEQALALNKEATDRFGENPERAMNMYGPQFGVIWFRKGVSELKLKKYEEAMKSFEATYKDFPNDKEKKGNLFEKMALLKWGEAAMGAEKYEIAIEQWNKFLQERDKRRDSYPRGAFHVNMAVSLYHLDKIPEGNEHLEIAITNKAKFPTPNAAIVAGFQALVETSIKNKNEQALLDFIAKNKGGLVVAPFEMQRFSKLFMKLAGDAIGAEMLETALALYKFVPSTQVAIDDLRSRLNDMGPLPRLVDGPIRLNKERMEKELATLETEQHSSKSIEMIKLAAIAYIYEARGHILGAYSAYVQLEKFFPSAEGREDNLFNLVRTSSMIGKTDQIQKYGSEFSTLYPNSKYKSDIQKLMLSSLFFEGKYEQAVEIASDLIEKKKIKEGTPEHDLTLFILGGSHFYMGEYKKAAPHLEKHVELYPESQFAMSADYFNASNTYRLQFLAKAATLLDAFIAKYKDDANPIFLPNAIYDRANIHYYQEEMEAALAQIDRLIEEFPKSQSALQAHILRGNVLQADTKNENAEEAYITALENAEASGNGDIAGEALYFLIDLIAAEENKDDEERLKQAIPYADKYWEKYAQNSPYRARVAVSQVPAFNAAGRSDDALKYLQEVISIMAKMAEADGLEAAIGAYTEAYLKNHSPEELKEHYYNFPDVALKDRVARALLRIAVIGVFEGVVKDAKDENEIAQANAMIQVLFQNLKTEFDLKDLSNYILVRLGDYLRNNTGSPREALPYYDEVLSRTDQSYRFDALLGRADIYGNSAKQEDLAKALEDFKRIFAEADEKSQREFALYRIIEVLMKKEDYAKAADRAREYLNRDKEKGEVLGFGTYTPEVGLILAQSFEERGMVDDAISMYVKVWSAHMGYVKISAPAVLSWMELQYKRNSVSSDPKVPSDRQGAYEGGYRYLELTGRFKDKMTKEEVKLWEDVQRLTDRYVADPKVKSMAQKQKELEDE